MQSFSAEPETSIPARRAKDLLDLITIINKWDERFMDTVKGAMLVGKITDHVLDGDSRFVEAFKYVQQAADFPAPPIPGSVIRQRQLVDELEAQCDVHPIVIDNQQQEVF